MVHAYTSLIAMGAESIADLESQLKKASAKAGGRSASGAEPGAAGLGVVSDGTAAGSLQDSELASALARRISEIKSAGASPVGGEAEELEEEEEEEEELAPQPQVPLTADELRSLIFKKYNKSHDMSIVRRDIPGKTFVCLNIMWSHMEQRSFKMTEEQVQSFDLAPVY